MISLRTHAGSIALAMMVGTSPISAQASLTVDGSLLRPGVDTFAVSYGGQTIGRGIQTMVALTDRGVRAWRQTYAFHSITGDVSTDTLLMDFKTLRPLRGARTSSQGRLAFAFTPTEVVTWTVSADGDSTAQRTTFPEPVFSSASLEAVVRSLPLGEGVQGQIIFFYPLPSTRGTVPSRVRVARSETLSLHNDGSQRTAWVVVVGESGASTTLWVAKDDRSIIQFDTEEGPAVIRFRR